MSKKCEDIRQGDVLLRPVAQLPEGCVEVPDVGGRIVLAYGEVTGHAHAIADHLPVRADRPVRPGAAAEMAEAAIARARLVRSPTGERYLAVREEVTLRHEEHTAHTAPPNVYLLPVQVEYTPAELRRVTD